MRQLTLLGLILLVGGCSFLFTTSPPEHVTPYTSLDCTTSNAAPVIDSVLGALSGVGTIIENNQGYPAGYVAIGVGWTVLYAASAIYGYAVTSDCRAAREKRDRMIEQEERRRWYPPPQPYPPAYSPPQQWTPPPQYPRPQHEPPPQPRPQQQYREDERPPE